MYKRIRSNDFLNEIQLAIFSAATMFAAVVLITGNVSAQENWPQWRGPKLDNVSKSKGLPDVLDESTQAWKIDMPGPAGATPVVWGKKIFVTSVDGSGLALLCVTTDGELKWKKPLAGKNQNVRMDRGNSASPSPVTDGTHVWVLSIGTLQCFDFDGELIWIKDLEEEYGEFDIQFGMTSTPILDDGRLYLQLIHGPMRKRGTSEGWVIALDAKDGKEIWKHKRETDAIAENKHAYTSPTLYKDGSNSYLLTHGGDFLIAHSLKDGSEIWRCGGFNPKDSYNNYLRLVASPVCAKGLIVVPSAKNGPIYGLKPDLQGDVTEQEDAKIWEVKKGTPDVATPLIHDDVVYLARENGVVIGLDAKTGEQLYQERILTDKHRSSPVVADGKIFLLGRKGRALVLKPGRELEVISKNELREEITASPAIADGQVFVRSYKSLSAFKKK